MPSLREYLFDRYFQSLMGVGYETNREKGLYVLLWVGSVCLTFASGYTTFLGLRQYVPSLFALFITIGINGILLAASMRIGVLLFSESFKLLLPIIFITTLAISVFFSYSALLDSIYDKPSRERDELQRSKIRAENLIHRFNQMLKETNNYDPAFGEITTNLNGWYSQTVQAYSGIITSLRDQLNKSKARSNNYTLSLNQLRRGRSAYGRNEAIARTESARRNVVENEIFPLEPQIERIDGAKEAFDNSYNNLIQSNITLTSENFGAMLLAYNNFVSELAVKRSMTVIAVPPDLQSSIATIDQLNRFFIWQGNELNVPRIQTLEELRQRLLEFVERLPRSNQGEIETNSQVQEALSEISTIGRYGGEQVHSFVLSVGELQNGNYLAIGSLIIATAIDGLVLLCGLLIAKPSSFLAMRKIEDLEDSLEKGLALIMSLNIQDRQATGNPFIDRIIRIFRLCEPDIRAAQERAIPVTISLENIRQEGLSREMGILLAAGLAKSHRDQERVGLTLRLLLWMAEQVQKYDSRQETARGFHDVNGG